MNFACTIVGDPRGKGSVRVYRGRAMKDAKTADYMATCISVMRAAHDGRPPIAEPTMVVIIAYVARPKSLVPKARARTPQPPIEAFYAPTFPDNDNLAKSVLDSLVQAGVIVDDRRTVELSVTKFYVPVGCSPRVDVVVRVAPAYGATAGGGWSR